MNTRKLAKPQWTEDVNVMAVIKGDERYVFLFDDANSVEVMRQAGRFAANPDLSFSWYDAAILSQRVRQCGKKK